MEACLTCASSQTLPTGRTCLSAQCLGAHRRRSQHALGRHRKSPGRCCARGDNARAFAVSCSNGLAAGTREVTHVDVQGGRYTVEGCLSTSVSPESVWDVLTDYDGLARTYSTVLESGSRVVNGQRQVLQKCRWEFLVFSGSFDTTLTVDEEPGAGRLVFRQLQSSFMRDFEGRWQVDALPAGGCRARHTLSVTPALAPPPPFEGPTQRMFSSQVEQLLGDLEAELLRRHPEVQRAHGK